MEAKAKVKDIAVSRDRVTLRDVLHEGICHTHTVVFSGYRHLHPSITKCISKVTQKLVDNVNFAQKRLG